MQQGVKLCVGLVQDWITLELAVRIRIEKGEYEFLKSDRNRLRATFKVVFLTLILGLIAWIITVIYSAHQPDNEGCAFGENYC